MVKAPIKIENLFQMSLRKIGIELSPSPLPLAAAAAALSSHFAFQMSSTLKIYECEIIRRRAKKAATQTTIDISRPLIVLLLILFLCFSLAIEKKKQ